MKIKFKKLNLAFFWGTLLTSLFLFFTNCSPSSGINPSDTNTILQDPNVITVPKGIYVLGSSFSKDNKAVATIWKDGVRIELPRKCENSSTSAYGLSAFRDKLIVLGSNVDTCSENSPYVDGIWVNSIWTPFPKRNSSIIYHRQGLAIDNGQVVAPVSEYNIPAGRFDVAYWLDQVWTYAELKYPNGQDITVARNIGNNIYFGAASGIDSGNVIRPGYFKNYKWVDYDPGLPLNYTIYTIKDFFVKENTIYHVVTINTPNHWYNYYSQNDEKALPLIEPDFASSSQGCVVYSGAISEKDVYAVGFCIDGSGVSRPGYWKNSVWNSLESLTANMSGTANRITIQGNNILIYGNSKINATDSLAVVWTNGIISTLPIENGGTSFIREILVVE